MEEEKMEPIAGLCIHNPGVFCDEHKCRNCGWDPTVEARRKKEIRSRVVKEERYRVVPVERVS